MDESFKQFLQLWGSRFEGELKLRLAQSYAFAPGFNGDAYSRGRDNQYAGQAPKSVAGSNSLYSSIQGQVTQDGFEILMNSYWEYVNYGVNPNSNYTGKTDRANPRGGSSPFISALQKWGQTKLGLDSKKALGMAFAVRQNIFKFGIAPTGFFEAATANLADDFELSLEEQMGKTIEDFFDKLNLQNI
jgi:hypothetical protein